MNKKIYDMANDIVTDFSETEEQEHFPERG